MKLDSVKRYDTPTQIAAKCCNLFAALNFQQQEASTEADHDQRRGQNGDVENFCAHGFALYK